MSSLCAGSPLVLVKTRPGYNRQSGKFTEYTYAGDHDSVYGMIGELDKADSWDIDHDGPQHFLKVRYSSDQSGTTETPIDEVRLHGNRHNQPIYDLPRFSTLTNDDRAIIRAVIQDKANINEVGFPDALSDYFPSHPETSLGLVLYNLLLLGVQHYVLYQPVLVRTRIASATFDFSGTSSKMYENVGRIIAPGSIQADAALPNPAYFTLPADNPANAPDGKAFGWLKHYPEYTQAAGNKAVLTQEYEYGLYSTIIYGAPV